MYQESPIYQLDWLHNEYYLEYGFIWFDMISIRWGNEKSSLAFKYDLKTLI